MMLNKIVFGICLFGLFISSCTPECENPCLSEDEFRTDTIQSKFLDTMLIKGGANATIAYTDSMGGEMLFTVTEYRFSYPVNIIKAPCGECGDSVTTIRYKSQFFYNMDNNNGLNVDITLKSDRKIYLQDKIYQCTEGEIQFNHDDGSTCTTRFAAECNGFLTPTTGALINSTQYKLLIDSTASLLCSPSDTTYVADTCIGSIKSFYINDSIPISHFNLNGVCWHFDGIK